MPIAEQLLDQLAALGVTIKADDDKLRIAPADKLSSALLDELRANKSDILAVLTSRMVDDLDACLRLGQRLKARAIPYVVCGITGKSCTSCGGVPCRGSRAP